MTPGSKPRSTTPNIGAGPANPGPKIGLGQYPPYALGGRAQELNPYSNVQSPYGRPPTMGYDAHPHNRSAGLSTNGIGNIPGGKP